MKNNQIIINRVPESIHQLVSAESDKENRTIRQQVIHILEERYEGTPLGKTLMRLTQKKGSK